MKNLGAIKYQVLITDKRDFVIKHETFYPMHQVHLQEIMKYVEEGIQLGDVQISRWDKFTGERI